MMSTISKAPSIRHCDEMMMKMLLDDENNIEDRNPHIRFFDFYLLLF